MRLLKEEGWEIHVAARDNLSEKDGLSLEYPDQVFDVPFQRSPLDRRNREALRQLREILSRNHYDVIHCNTPVGGILTRWAARKYRRQGTKVFYTAHGFHFYKGAPKQNWLLYYPLEKFFAHYTDCLITINQEDEKLARKHFHCPVRRIHGVGADTARYHLISEKEKADLRKQLGLQGTILLAAGELLPNKNQKAAILALPAIQKQIPDVHLLIAGNGPERQGLESLVQQMGLTEAVTFLGYTTRLPQYVQACDVFLSCSYREGLPLNILEAMLCGKPVAASDNRGHRELVQPGINGFLFAPDDREGLKQGVLSALEMTVPKRLQIPESIWDYTDSSVREELKEIYGCVYNG